MPRAARHRLSLQSSPAGRKESQSSARHPVSVSGPSQSGYDHEAAESDADTSGNNSASCPQQERPPSELSVCHREDPSFHVYGITKNKLTFFLYCVSVDHAHNDYSAYENLFCSDNFRHVIEIYNFPVAFQTQDLLDAFTEYSSGGMKIKWVDDTHALGVFSSEEAGENVENERHLGEPDFLQPVKERPKTDSAVARRMVTRALGVPSRDRVRRF
uniref:R3H domain and coiled-coil containing 1 n=1 Tax=Oryzias melastigma TaxID=30732 RepID=A0A3B3BL19_ORYME